MPIASLVAFMEEMCARGCCRSCGTLVLAGWKRIAADARGQLTHALEALPPRFREVIVLRELEGCSYKEIATITSIPIGTVMSTLSRARHQLQLALVDPVSKEATREL